MATILVVDDRTANREALVTLLGYQGHRLLEARDGAEALVLTAAERPDLVITDILMPTMDGYEFVRQLRADPAIAKTDVIFCTAHYRGPEAQNLARACGVQYILTKPCVPGLVRRTVEQALGTPAPPVRAEVQEFDHEHLRLVTDKLSETAGELRLINERLAALIETNLQLASERDPRQLLNSVCGAARELAGAKYAVLAVGNRDEGNTGYVATSGMGADLVSSLGRLVLREGIVGAAFEERNSRRGNNSGGDPRKVGLPAHHPPVHSFLVAPILSLAHTYGWICLTDKLGGDEFSAEDERLLGILGAQVGRIYENGSLYAALQESEAGLHRAQLMARLAHVITGPDGSFETWSETLPQLIGADSARMPGSAREWLDILHPEDRAMFRANAIDGGVRGMRTDVEYRLRRTDGAWINVRHVMEPLEGRANPDGKWRWFNSLQDVTEQKRAAEALQASEERFRAMFEKAAVGITHTDLDGRFVMVNPKLCEITGYTQEEAPSLTFRDLTHPDDVHKSVEFRARLLEGTMAPYEREARLVRKDRSLIWVNITTSLVRAADGTPLHFISVLHDISERKTQQRKIERLSRVYAVLSGINALIVRVRDRDELFREACRIAVEAGNFRMAWLGVVDRKAMQVKPMAWHGTGEDYIQLMPLELSDAVPEGYGLAGRAVKERKAMISDDMTLDPRVRLREEALARGFHSLVVLPLIVAEEAVGVLALYAGEIGFFDEDEMKLLLELAGDIAFAMDHIEKQERLDYLAYYDSLTGLANRTLFLERLNQFTHAAAQSQEKFALVLLNIERLRTVNESLGRPAGDALLKQVAERLALVAGRTEVGRISADQFAVVLAAVKGRSHVGRMLQTISRNCFGEPFRIDDSELRLSAKAGIALFPNDGAAAETLFRNAEAALRKCKETGEPSVFYSQALTARTVERLTLENKLRTALEKEEFVLHYQPKVELATRRIAGVEALIRWQSPELGLVPPGRFIPLMEETGLILDVGAWALTKAAADHLRWLESGLAAPRVAVNVSAIQLRRREFLSTVQEAIKHGATPAGIDLEITESLVMEDIESNIEKLREVRGLGVSIAIDDFGTGYSSLAYLAKLPVHSLKIDRSFVVTMMNNPDTMTLVQTIISLAHSLKLKVVAEGVELENQAKMLRLLRCDEMQGYLFSRPVPFDDMTALLAQGKQV